MKICLTLADITLNKKLPNSTHFDIYDKTDIPVIEFEDNFCNLKDLSIRLSTLTYPSLIFGDFLLFFNKTPAILYVGVSPC